MTTDVTQEFNLFHEANSIMHTEGHFHFFILSAEALANTYSLQIITFFQPYSGWNNTLLTPFL